MRTVYWINLFHATVNQRNTRTRCEICSKLTIKTPERRPGVLIVNFEHISHLVLVFLLLTLNGNYMFKVNNRNTRTRCEICSKLTIKKRYEKDQWHESC